MWQNIAFVSFLFTKCSINICIQFYSFHILCLHFYFLVVSSKVWYRYVTVHVKFSLFMLYTLIYVHVNLLVTHCKEKLITYLRCISLFGHFPFLYQFGSILENSFQILEKGKCLQFSHQPIGYVVAQLFIVWNTDFGVSYSICYM